MAITPVQSPKYFCTKCGWNTSGMVSFEYGSKIHICVCCKSPLFRCGHCLNYVSGVIDHSEVACDNCKKINTLEFIYSQLNYEEDAVINQTVLSGIRATGKLHFGNLLGAVQNFVKFQTPENKCLYFIADWHTLTTLQNPEELRKNLIEVVKDYIAAGLDPEKSIIYAQSSVPEIAELCLYLSMIQPLGDLERIPTFKDLIRKNSDNINLGLVTYPVLMAADILGPKATIVPVGEDQIPNVELARSLALKFNNRFGDTFVIPEMMQQMIKVPGLDGGKMGKSESDNAIDINSSISEIREKYYKKGVTDVERKRISDKGDPYTRCKSVYPLHEIITLGEKESRNIANACRSATIGCRDCKTLLVNNISNILAPFQEARAKIAEKNEYVKEVIHEGGKNARKLIRETTMSVRDKMGIVIY